MTFSKHRFSKFKRFLSWLNFGEVQFTQISLNFQTFCCNSKIGWLFYYFNFERNYDVLKSKSQWILLSKTINFNKNKMELKMENLTYTF